MEKGTSYRYMQQMWPHWKKKTHKAKQTGKLKLASKRPKLQIRMSVGIEVMKGRRW